MHPHSQSGGLDIRHLLTGFTLVEIAIVLVIIGLLLGGILKGQELINSARVRNLADTTSGVQAAYFGFVDRYRRVPGDWQQTAANAAIGGAIVSGGNDNGRLDVLAAPNEYQEPNALWEHLSKAGFVSGSYTGTTAEPTTENGAGPFNPFNSAIIVARTNNYADVAAAPPARLHLIVGRGTPVDIARELDTKLDDSVPNTGNVRAAGVASPLGGGSGWGDGDATCVAAGPPVVWNVAGDSQDCNVIYLF
ncbi:MAG: prepilin-type N-terminal cleavage/methylation domain-containing protein [Gammaproteobacteria bacterium]